MHNLFVFFNITIFTLLTIPNISLSNMVTSFESNADKIKSKGATCVITPDKSSHNNRSLKFSAPKYIHGSPQWTRCILKNISLRKNAELSLDIYNDEDNSQFLKIIFKEVNTKNKWLFPVTLSPKKWNNIKVPLWLAKDIINLNNDVNVNLVLTRVKTPVSLFIDNVSLENLSLKDHRILNFTIINSPLKNSVYYFNSDKPIIDVLIQSYLPVVDLENTVVKIILKDKKEKTIHSTSISNKNISKNNIISLPIISTILDDKVFLEFKLINNNNTLWVKKIAINLLDKNKKTIAINENGYLTFSNKILFPIGIFNAPESELKSIAKIGFNSVHSYKSVNETYISKAKKEKLYVLPSIPKSLEPSSSRKLYYRENSNIDKIKEYIISVVDNPNLLGFYYYDEPSPHKISKQELISVRNKLHELAPYKLLFGTNNKYHEFFFGAPDVMLIDEYPIPYRGFSRMIKKLVLNNKLQRENDPYFFISQAMNIESYFTHKFNLDVLFRTPSFDELRTTSWLSVLLNSKGIFFYSYQIQGFYVRNAFPWFWYGLSEHVNELKILTPWLKADFLDNDIMSESDDIVVAKKGLNGHSLYIIINKSDKAIIENFHVENSNLERLYVISENRNTKVLDGNFKDQFNPRETHLYTTDPKFYDHSRLKSLPLIRHQIKQMKEDHDKNHPSLFTYRDGARLHASWEFPEPELVNRKVFYRMIDGYPGTQWVIGNKYSKANIPGWESKDFTSAGRWIEVRSPVEKLINRIKVITSDDLEFEIRVLKNDKWVSLKHQVIEDKQYHHKYTTKTSIAKFSPQPIDRFRIILPEKSKQHTEVVFELSAWLEN